MKRKADSPPDTTATLLFPKGWMPAVLWALGDKYRVTCYPNKGPCVRVREGLLELKKEPNSKVYVPVHCADVQLKGTRYWEGVAAWTRGETLHNFREYYDDATFKLPSAPAISAGALEPIAASGVETTGRTVTFFVNLRERLLAYLAVADYTHVVGWCPWVTDPDVLIGLTRKARVCLVVRSDQEEGVAKKARNMKHLWPRVSAVCYWPVPPTTDQLLCEKNAPGQGYPTLHGKVMIFGQADGDDFKPLAVWRGSCNWTFNAFDRNVAEEASFCDDPTLAQAYYARFLQLLVELGHVTKKDDGRQKEAEGKGKEKKDEDEGHVKEKVEEGEAKGEEEESSNE